MVKKLIPDEPGKKIQIKIKKTIFIYGQTKRLMIDRKLGIFI